MSNGIQKHSEKRENIHLTNKKNHENETHYVIKIETLLHIYLQENLNIIFYMTIF